MSRTTGVVVALATTAAVLTGSTVGASPPAAPAGPPGVADLPREVEGGVELLLADGDRLRVFVDDGFRAVWSKRYDAATRTWGGREVVLREKGLACGDVDARTSNGAVAVMAMCNEGGYPEDSPPTDSRALWSADTVSWSSYALEGEAYDEPGISPDGSRAVWPEFRGYVTWGPEGFVRYRFEAPGEEYTTTATISDDAQVSYLYGASVSRRRCALVVLTRTGEATPVRQEVPLEDACQDVDLANVDADTVLFGELQMPASVTDVSRAGAASPWAVTRVAPAAAPGLERQEGRLYTEFVTAPGAPLVALGSRRGRQVRAQVYDPDTQTWGSPTVAYRSSARCRWSDAAPVDAPAVLVAVVSCRDDNVVLTTRDGVTWQALWMGPRSLGQSRDGRYVAVPGPAGTHVISPELGVVTLPFGVDGRCDVVVPDGPDAAVHLVAANRSRRWPVLLERVSADGTERLDRVRTPTPGRCSDADQSYDGPGRFDMISTRIDRGQTVRIVRRGGGWKAWVTTW